MGDRDSDRPTAPPPQPQPETPRRSREQDETLPRIEIHRRALRDIVEVSWPRGRPDPRRD